VCASVAERAFLGIGSNLGDRLAHLQGAVDGLAAHPAVEVAAVSGVYETAPVGGPPQPPYLNAVLEVRTRLDPLALLEVAQGLERAAGRRRTVRWGPRTLDVDLLWVGGRRLRHPRLELPHPRMRERGFVLVPLADLAPGLAGGGGRRVWRGVRRAGVALRTPGAGAGR
jgi:2-amino-4-hydroxy-6-hydroxymethyldihydropteridine diphosphokinase